MDGGLYTVGPNGLSDGEGCHCYLDLVSTVSCNSCLQDNYHQHLDAVVTAYRQANPKMKPLFLRPASQAGGR